MLVEAQGPPVEVGSFHHVGLVSCLVLLLWTVCKHTLLEPLPVSFGLDIPHPPTTSVLSEDVCGLATLPSWDKDSGL